MDTEAWIGALKLLCRVWTEPHSSTLVEPGSPSRSGFIAPHFVRTITKWDAWQKCRSATVDNRAPSRRTGAVPEPVGRGVMR